MIRDPSDGSVREKLEMESVLPSPSMPTPEPGMTGISPAISGLPAGSTKPENLARLEKSREWLRDYHKTKGGVE